MFYLAAAMFSYAMEEATERQHAENVADIEEDEVEEDFDDVVEEFPPIEDDTLPDYIIDSLIDWDDYSRHISEMDSFQESVFYPEDSWG